MKKITILGAGVSGQAAAALAKKEGLDFKILTDSDFEGWINWGDLIVASPGVPPKSPMYQAARESGVPMTGELAFGARFFRGRMAAVTGTDGKTTTTELLTSLLAAGGEAVRPAGNIGVPLSQLAADGFAGIAAVEVSSFQLELADNFAPEAAAILNISMDHRDRYPGGEEEYRSVKYRIFRRVPEKGRIFGRSMDELTPEPRTLFMDGTFFVDGLPLVKADELALQGEHNRENICVALELAVRMLPGGKIFAPEVVSALKGFAAGPHRIETVLEKNGICYVDDSKATNPHAVVSCVRTLSARGVKRFRMLMGGLDKGMDFEMLSEVRNLFAGVYLFGACRERLKQSLTGVPCLDFGTDFEAAVRQACRDALPGEAVLLAPGCASMDMFRNYEERGERFRDCVLAEL